MIADTVVKLLLETPKLETLKKHRASLTPEEKAAFPKDLPKGDCASLLKAEIDDETWYACYTHRACHVSKNLKDCVAAYPSIAATA